MSGGRYPISNGGDRNRAARYVPVVRTYRRGAMAPLPPVEPRPQSPAPDYGSIDQMTRRTERRLARQAAKRD